MTVGIIRQQKSGLLSPCFCYQGGKRRRRSFTNDFTAKTNSATHLPWWAVPGETTEKTREKNSKNSVVSVAKPPFCSGVKYGIYNTHGRNLRFLEGGKRMEETRQRDGLCGADRVDLALRLDRRSTLRHRPAAGFARTGVIPVAAQRIFQPSDLPAALLRKNHEPEKLSHRTVRI